MSKWVNKLKEKTREGKKEKERLGKEHGPTEECITIKVKIEIISIESQSIWQSR